MTRSASGTYSLPSACMKSYWVSTSQKMTRAMARNLSEDTGACQPEGGRAKALPGLKSEHYCDLVTAVVARAPHAVGPHLEREVLALGGREPELHKKLGFAGQREDLCQAVRPRLGNQRREQGTSDARPLPILPHRERGELRQVAGVHLERPAPDDLARRRFRDYVLLDMAAEIVVRTGQQGAALAVRSHQDFQLRHVGERGPPPRRRRPRAARGPSRPARAPSHSALRRTSARNAGSAIVRPASSAPPATSGPPPNVVAWSPGLSAPATAFVTRTAPIGNPPASGFASVRMSGTTPACS